MGAGHDGAARNLAERLQSLGHAVEVRDFLTSGPLRIGSALRRGYEFELKHVPSAYEATYRLWYRAPWLCPVVAWLVTFLTKRRVLRWARRSGARAVVSTYPLATLCLGRLRRSGRLTVPVVNFITDFGVHPLWVHKGVDLNLAVHDTPAEHAAARSGRRTLACGPAVSPLFDPECLPARLTARAALGLGDDQRAVLIVAGSWGVGNLTATWEAISASGRFVPVVVCGRDEHLKRVMDDLAARNGTESVVLGWTDWMPTLMAACDALVENAGGLTSLEAMRAGLPVVSFDPIAGHGKENTAAMHAAGVARLAADRPGLVAALDELTRPGPARSAQVDAAAAIFREDPGELVAGLVGATAGQPLPARRRAGLAVRLAVGATAFAVLGWTGLTTGVAMATEAGAGVATPAPVPTSVVYVGVRLDAEELADPAVVSRLKQVDAAAVVDGETAESEPAALRALVQRGVSLASGGVGEDVPGGSSDLPWVRAWSDARAGEELSQLAGTPVNVSVPGRRLTAWDLIESSHAHVSLVVPDHIVDASAPPVAPLHVAPRGVYLVNGLQATPDELLASLSELQESAAAEGLAVEPLSLLS